MIRDWNRENLKGQVFHFKASLRPFTEVSMVNDFGFLDLSDFNTYELDDLKSEGLFFFEKENDEDFKGVDVVGHLEWDVR